MDGYFSFSKHHTLCFTLITKHLQCTVNLFQQQNTFYHLNSSSLSKCFKLIITLDLFRAPSMKSFLDIQIFGLKIKLPYIYVLLVYSTSKTIYSKMNGNQIKKTTKFSSFNTAFSLLYFTINKYIFAGKTNYLQSLNE